MAGVGLQGKYFSVAVGRRLRNLMGHKWQAARNKLKGRGGIPPCPP